MEMKFMSFKSTKLFLVFILIIFLLVALLPGYLLMSKITPLLKQKENYIQQSEELSMTRFYHARLTLLEAISTIDNDRDFTLVWKELSEKLLKAHKKYFGDNASLLEKRLAFFESYYTFIRRIGRENTGLVGKMRESAHEVEARISSDKAMVMLLQMRRREKDFLLRKDQKYVDLFMQAFSNIVDLKNNLPIKAIILEYKRTFQDIVELTRQEKRVQKEYERLAKKYGLFLENEAKAHAKEDVDVLNATSRAIDFILTISFVSIAFLSGILIFVYGYLTRENKYKLRMLEEKIHLQDELISHEKLAGLGVLAAGIAHEIKNPLTIILNAAELITDVFEKNPKFGSEPGTDLHLVKESGGYIKKHAQRADSIVKNMLTLARGKDREMSPNPLKDIILENYYLAYHSMRATRPIEVDFEERIDDIPAFLCNRSDLSQVFINIFENSFYALSKKLETQSYSPCITVSLKEKDNIITIKVRDNGCGISKEDLSKITEPFFTTKPAGEGTGLGMSFVFDVINDHNGKMNLRSEVNSFTEIEIILQRG